MFSFTHALLHTVTGLHQCEAMIAVITNKYTASRYCNMELLECFGEGINIFPLIYEDVDFKASQKAKAVRMVIRGYQYTDFRSKKDYDTSLKKLVAGLKKKDLGAQQEQ